MKLLRYVIFILLLATGFTSFSQDKKLEELIKIYQSEKNDSIKLMKIEKAYSYSNKSKTRTEEQHITVLEQLYLYQFENYEDENAAKTAEKLLTFIQKKTTKEFLQKKIQLSYFAFSTYQYLQDFSRAIAALQINQQVTEQLHGKKSNENLQCYIHFVSLYSRVDNVKQQIAYLEKANEIVTNTTNFSKNLVFDFYNYSTVTYLYYGDLDKAKFYLDQLNKFYQENKNDYSFINFKINPESKINEIKSSLALANLYFHKLETGDKREIPKINAFFNSIINPSLIYPLSDIQIINDFFIQMGVYYTHTEKDYNKAIQSYSSALLFNKNDNHGIIHLNYQKGWSAVKFKKWKEATNYFEKSLSMPDSEKFFEINDLYVLNASAYYHLNDFKKAEKYIDKTTQFYAKNSFTDQGFVSLVNLSRLGNLYIDIYKKTNKKDKKQLQKAFVYFTKASLLFKNIYLGDSFNPFLSQKVEVINEGLLYCASEMKDKKGQVFEMVEKNKSDFLWANFLQNNTAKSLVNPKQLIDSIKQLSSQKEVLIAQNTLPKSKTVAIENQIKELQNQIKKKYPNYINFLNNEISISEIQSQLKHNEIILNYIVFDSIVYGFKLSKSSLTLHEITKKTHELKTKSLRYIECLKHPTYTFTKESQALHQILIEPFKLQKNQKLTIICSSFLSYLPFETLMNNSTFLTENHTISYGSSLKLWNTQILLPKSKGQKLVAFSPAYSLAGLKSTDADVALLTREGNYELKGAKEEAKKISMLFDGSFFDAEKATKKNFITNASNYQILHLAMHSIMNEEDENQSNLIFSNNEKLYFSEIYNLQLPAELAVLSACNTGNGNYKDGEGIMSMSRAFTIAGIKSTVRSLWQVPDVETSEIMIVFYENLKKGQSKDEALAHSKNTFLANNPLKKHPFYWAGFVVSGDVSPLATSNNNWLIYVGVFVLLLSLFCLFRKKVFR